MGDIMTDTPLCPVCPPGSGWASIMTTTDSAAPSGIGVNFVCWHRHRVEPPPGYAYPSGETAAEIAERTWDALQRTAP